MKRLLIISIFIVLTAAVAKAFEENIDPNQSGSIAISGTAGAPTQIFTNDPTAMRTYIVNITTNNIFIVGYSTTSALSISTFSTVSTSLVSGSFFIPASTNTVTGGAPVPVVWSPDGGTDPYRGPMWAVSGNGGVSITRFRAH